MTEVTIQPVRGPELEPWIPQIARLRIAVFREFPYLYEGSLEYEEEYLQPYLASRDSVAVLARDGDDVVGVSTGMPLADETEAFQRPFVQRGMDVIRVFYLAESVLLPPYRGRGLYRHFMQGRETHARKIGQFDTLTFCAVQREADHPMRPANDRPLNRVWEHYGYVEQPQMTTLFPWRDIGDEDETEKTMVFWVKALNDSNAT